MEAVPKRRPAVTPSAKEAFFAGLFMQTALSLFNRNLALIRLFVENEDVEQ
jgi:hypothetical protein